MIPSAFQSALRRVANGNLARKANVRSITACAGRRCPRHHVNAALDFVLKGQWRSRRKTRLLRLSKDLPYAGIEQRHFLGFADGQSIFSGQNARPSTDDIAGTAHELGPRKLSPRLSTHPSSRWQPAPSSDGSRRRPLPLVREIVRYGDALVRTRRPLLAIAVANQQRANGRVRARSGRAHPHIGPGRGS